LQTNKIKASLETELTFILIASTILSIFNPSLLHKILQPAFGDRSGSIYR